MNAVQFVSSMLKPQMQIATSSNIMSINGIFFNNDIFLQWNRNVYLRISNSAFRLRFSR